MNNCLYVHRHANCSFRVKSVLTQVRVERNKHSINRDTKRRAMSYKDPKTEKKNAWKLLQTFILLKNIFLMSIGGSIYLLLIMVRTELCDTMTSFSHSVLWNSQDDTEVVGVRKTLEKKRIIIDCTLVLIRFRITRKY